MKRTEVQTRWQDMDALGHVNNAVILNYLEEGRNALLADCGIDPEDYVVGRCSVVFRAELDSGIDFVTVECQVKRLGRSSLATTERILTGDEECAVEAEFGIVLWDPRTRRPRPISSEEHTTLEVHLTGGDQDAMSDPGLNRKATSR